MTTYADFMRHVLRSDSGCWLWTGSVAINGYSQVGDNGRTRSAHCVSYEIHVGPIPEGLQIDHTCHKPGQCAGGPSCVHRRCVNPAHLEAVTQSVNMQRAVGDKCSNGHEYTPENTRIRKDTGRRICKACAKATNDKRYVGYGKRGKPSKAARLALEASRRAAAS